MADESRGSGGEELLTLTEVSNRTRISMPTLQRYKKEYQDRLPTVGEGRRQRYPVSALAVFEEIKKENIARRGRPRKSDSDARKGGRKPAKKKEKARSDLLTLTEVSERTRISYPTLVRYVKLHGDRIPYEGEGRRRRYHPEAVEVFNEIRSQSGRGRKKKKAAGGAAPSGAARAAAGGTGDGAGRLAQRVQSLERSQERLEKQIRDLIDQLRKPMTVTLQRGK